MGDLLLERWDSDIVTGDRKPEKPSLVGFSGSVNALEILNKHIKRNGRIAIHCDVDVDGIGSGYIMKAFLKSLGCTNTLFLINKDKVHGIQEKHVEYFNDKNNCDLLIVLDSSTNEIDNIKKFKNDVIVIDHHEILHEEMCGQTNDEQHNYVIINNMIGNKDVGVVNGLLTRNKNMAVENIGEYVADERMSGAMVLYELLRVYEVAYKTGPILENLFLYQWVGVTLFSDAIKLVSDRNQWYIENTVHSQYIEGCLGNMMAEVNEYKVTLDKSFISFTLAPIINKAIRGGGSGEALDIVLNRPRDIKQLDKYKEKQDSIIKMTVSESVVYKEEFIMKDITNMGIGRNYCGVIASRLCGNNNKNTVVYKVNGDIAEGSFRGRRGDVDYRKYFESYSDDVFAQGHKVAFGFRVNVGILKEIMSKLRYIEPNKSKVYLTSGAVGEENKGVHHIDSINEFKKQGNFWRLATANSKLSTDEQLEIVTSIREAIMVKQVGKLYIYDVMGMTCKAFEPLNSELVKIYTEYSKDIEVYVRNIKI